MDEPSLREFFRGLRAAHTVGQLRAAFRGRDRLVKGEREMAGDNRTLGRFHLEGIPPAPKGEVHIDVVFEIDVNGCLIVRATDHLSGARKEVKLYISAGYDEATLDEMRARSGLEKLGTNRL